MPYTYSEISAGETHGRERRCWNCDLQKFYRWCFLLSSEGNSVMLVGLTAAMLIQINNDNNKSSFTFEIAILFIGLVAGWFAFHGIVFEYQYDIYLHLVTMSMALIYCWLDYSYSEGMSTIKLIRGIVASSLLIPTVLFALCVTCSEYWTEFYIVGASEEILTMYKKLRLFLSLLKFDLQTTVIVAIFTLKKNGSESSFHEVLPLIVISIYGILFCIVVAYGVRNEHSLPLFIFVLGSVALPIWVTYKIVNENCFTVVCSKNVEAGFNYAVFTAGILAVIVRMFILVELMKVYKNFGYGLSDRAFSYLASPESTSLLGRPIRGSL